MRMEPLLFYGRMVVGRDQLGNDIYQNVLLSESVGRFSTWTTEEIALDTRNVTVNARKVITPARMFNMRFATAIKIGNKYHNIQEIKGDDYNRWRIIVVDKFGRDQYEN